MRTSFSTNLRNSRASSIASAIDGQSGLPGKLIVNKGTRPSTGASYDELDVLGIVLFQYPCTDNVSNGTLQFKILPETLASGEGLISWCRVTDSDGNFVMDSDAGALGSGNQFEFTHLELTIETFIKCYAASIVEGNV